MTIPNFSLSFELARAQARAEKDFEEVRRKQETWAKLSLEDKKRFPREIEGTVVKEDSK